VGLVGAGEQILRCREVRFAPFGNSADRTNRAKNAAGVPQEVVISGVDPLVRVSLMAAQRSAGGQDGRAAGANEPRVRRVKFSVISNFGVRGRMSGRRLSGVPRT
jgi:hypothetical protein